MLNERKKKILQLIIEDYISTAEPVGSRTIARKYDLGLSPATIRNEMSDLELLGYLEQPHTSAGRVPSAQAYRLYVDSLVEPGTLTDNDRALINGWFSERRRSIDEIFQFVTGALVFGQPSVQVSIYPFRMTDANMARHKYSYYADFWKQLKPGYDYFEQTHKPPTVSVADGRYIVSKPLSHEVVHPQLASNYTVPETK